MTTTAAPTMNKPNAASASVAVPPASSVEWDKGLASTIAAETEMSFIDGAKGILEYVGIEIDALARNSTFEEVVFLLWNRRLPKKDELAAFTKSIQAEYDLPEHMWDMIRECPKEATPMHALRTLVSALGMFDPEADDESIESNQRKAIKLLAKTPALIANFDRHRKGKEFAKPDKSQPIAGAFLTMLGGGLAGGGKKPTAAVQRALDVCLILQADHGLNASTFAARVTISTLSDMYSAITTAIGALKGPLHGGANEEVMHMLNEIASPGDDTASAVAKVEPYIMDKLQRKERIMGFGHRVYKAYDPRASYLKEFSQQVAADTGNLKLYEMSHRIEEIMNREVAAKGIYPNVDFYSATTYYSLGLDLDLFTPMFAMSRIAGWSGHCIEQLRDNRLIRPKAQYTGPHGVKYVGIDAR